MCYRGKEKIKMSIPQANVIKIVLESNAWIAIRPSGTEPKIKFYLSCKGTSQIDVKTQILELQNYINQILDLLF